LIEILDSYVTTRYKLFAIGHRVLQAWFFFRCTVHGFMTFILWRSTALIIIIIIIIIEFL